MKSYNRDPNKIFPDIHKSITKNAKDYSIIREFKALNRINDDFLKTIRKFPLEDLIAIKLEDSVAVMNTRKLYNLPIYHSIKRIVKDATIKFAFSATGSQWAASRFLGVHMEELYKIIRSYKTDLFFEQLIHERKENDLKKDSDLLETNIK